MRGEGAHSGGTSQLPPLVAPPMLDCPARRNDTSSVRLPADEEEDDEDEQEQPPRCHWLQLPLPLP